MSFRSFDQMQYALEPRLPEAIDKALGGVRFLANLASDDSCRALTHRMDASSMVMWYITLCGPDGWEDICLPRIKRIDDGLGDYAYRRLKVMVGGYYDKQPADRESPGTPLLDTTGRLNVLSACIMLYAVDSPSTTHDVVVTADPITKFPHISNYNTRMPTTAEAVAAAHHSLEIMHAYLGEAAAIAA